jgi:uncharacterized RDD family membrane protein YckC
MSRTSLFDLVRIALCGLVVALVVVAAAGAEVAQRSVASGERLLGAWSGGNLWWIAREPSAFRLMHVGAKSPETAREVADHGSMPEAIAAAQDFVWLVFPPNAGDADRRSVLWRRVAWNEATKLYFAVPPQGDVLPSLPGKADLLGFAADERGPFALLAASPGERLGVQRLTQAERAADAAVRGATLLRLQGLEWIEVDLPPDLAAARGLATVPSLDGGAPVLGVVAASKEPGPDGRPTTILGRLVGQPVVQRGADGASTAPASAAASEWSIERTNVPFDDRRPATWHASGGRTVRIEDTEEGARLDYVRDDRLLAWATVEAPADPWLVATTDDGAVVVTARSESQEPERVGPRDVRSISWTFTRASIGSTDGAPGPFVALEPPGFGAAAWIHLPLLAMVLMTVLLAVAFFRALSTTPEEERAARPADAPPHLPFDRRLMALGIDLLPPAVLVLLVFRVPPSELLFLPSWTLDIERTVPSLVMILLTCVHTGVSESVAGTTLGKRLLHGGVLLADGSPLGIGRGLVRAIFKGVLLSAPILGILALFHRDRRTVADLMARSVVVDLRPEAKELSRRDEDPS